MSVITKVSTLQGCPSREVPLYLLLAVISTSPDLVILVLTDSRYIDGLKLITSPLVHVHKDTMVPAAKKNKSMCSQGNHQKKNKQKIFFEITFLAPPVPAVQLYQHLS